MKTVTISCAVVGAIAVLSSTAAIPTQTINYNKTNIWDFALLQPSAEFQWTPCFDNFTCTILEVPLDYSDTAAGTVGIAFIKWTAENASTAQDILINPGGPGGSGVATVQQNLGELQKHLGSVNNIIGFDPRGVNNSGPQLSCFPGKRDTYKLYNAQWSKPVDSTSASSMLEQWTGAGAFGDWCTYTHHSGSVARYVNTVATATDMLHYAELVAETKGQKKEDAKLWYYGASYGTILGSTFAALYPDRAGRLILDGVADGDDYYQGKWQANIVDADESIDSFFKDCFRAGKELCEFWDASPGDIKRRFEAIAEDLKASPITVTNQTQVQTPVVITLGDFKTYLAKVPYDPIRWFPEFAKVLADLEKRNGSYFASVTGAGLIIDQCTPNEAQPIQYEPRFFIGCNDAGGRFNISTLDVWNDHVHLLLNQSKWLGEIWANVAVGCRSLEISNHVPESQKFRGPPSATNTSTPILFISTALDPVTPLRAAIKAAGLFGGSRVLIQNSVGHASISAPSACSHKVIVSYLKDATLPDEDTVCEVDEIPFNTQYSNEARSNMGLLGKIYPLGRITL